MKFFQVINFIFGTLMALPFVFLYRMFFRNRTKAIKIGSVKDFNYAQAKDSWQNYVYLDEGAVY